MLPRTHSKSLLEISSANKSITYAGRHVTATAQSAPVLRDSFNNSRIQSSTTFGGISPSLLFIMKDKGEMPSALPSLLKVACKCN